MFDIGFWEMAFIGVIALVVIGPDKLPAFARTAGLWIGKGRRMINDVKSDIKKEMSEEDLKSFREFKSDISGARDSVRNAASSASDSLGIKEAGEGIKKSFNEAKSGIESLKETSTGKTSAGSSSKKPAKKKTAKKSAAKKKTAKKPAAKTAGTRKKTTGKKAAKKKSVSTAKTDKKGNTTPAGSGATEKSDKA